MSADRVVAAADCAGQQLYFDTSFLRLPEGFAECAPPHAQKAPHLPFAASEARQGVQLLLIMGFFNNRECNSAGQRTGVDPACPLFMDIAATQAVDSEMKQVYTEGLIQGASCCKP